MQEQSKKEHNQGFLFGAMLGGLVGSAGLYLLGTKKGREKLRSTIDTFENFDEHSIEKILKDVHEKITDEKIKPEHNATSNIHTVLDKIQSALPTKKEVKKYFAKDGKVLK